MSPQEVLCRSCYDIFQKNEGELLVSCMCDTCQKKVMQWIREEGNKESEDYNKELEEWNKESEEQDEPNQS